MEELLAAYESTLIHLIIQKRTDFPSIIATGHSSKADRQDGATPRH